MPCGRPSSLPPQAAEGGQARPPGRPRSLPAAGRRAAAPPPAPRPAAPTPARGAPPWAGSAPRRGAARGGGQPLRAAAPRARQARRSLWPLRPSSHLRPAARRGGPSAGHPRDGAKTLLSNPPRRPAPPRLPRRAAGSPCGPDTPSPRRRSYRQPGTGTGARAGSAEPRARHGTAWRGAARRCNAGASARLPRAGEPGRGGGGRQAARLPVPAARREREHVFPRRGGRACAGCRGSFGGARGEAPERRRARGCAWLPAAGRVPRERSAPAPREAPSAPAVLRRAPHAGRAEAATAGRAVHGGSAEVAEASRCTGLSALGIGFGRFEERGVSYASGW